MAEASPPCASTIEATFPIKSRLPSSSLSSAPALATARLQHSCAPLLRRRLFFVPLLVPPPHKQAFVTGLELCPGARSKPATSRTQTGLRGNYGGPGVTVRTYHPRTRYRRGPRLRHGQDEDADCAKDIEDGTPLRERSRYDLVGPEVGEVPGGVAKPTGRHDVTAEVRVH